MIIKFDVIVHVLFNIDFLTCFLIQTKLYENCNYIITLKDFFFVKKSIIS